TPSGHIHVGNMREVLTGDSIYRSCLDLGLPAKLIYLGDDMDPLRKVYPFLDDSYQEHIGKPLFEIPCPCGGHKSYSEHFLEPFLEALKRTGIEAEVVLVHEGYEAGQYAPAIRKVIARKDEVRDILTRVSGREMPDDWFPYTPKCTACGKFADAVATGFEDPHVTYTCKCGGEGKIDINTARGKLPWRLEWPARWQNLEVFCEPYGKDHAAAGGSWDSGSAIMKDILGGEPPHPVVYEWIQLKGVGAMASSTGVVVRAVDMLKMTPPEVMRFLIARYQPNKHIDFDPGLGILNLVDEYDRYERVAMDIDEPAQAEKDRKEDMKRVYRFSLPGEMPASPPLYVPYRHFVSLVQIADGWEGIRDIILRTEGLEVLSQRDEERLRKRADVVRYWLEHSAPETVLFSIQEEPPDTDLSEEARTSLRVLRNHLEKAEWDAGAIHDAIYAAAEETGLKAKELFKAAYMVLIAKPRGPRLGFFLSIQSKEWVLERLAHYSG
ncbi:MAG: lysine--tRNA ligase, partial [Thermoplasmata archaeon]|nr:lysine--tRNA ligase [Thermoplasmata archaeon]